MQPFPTFQNYLNYPQPSQPMYSYGNIAQPMASQNITGRTVADFNEITASEIPMDGRSAFFPKSDMSEIAVKNWAADGTIRTVSFKPVVSPQTNISTTEMEKNDSDPFGEVLRGIQSDIKMLTEKIDKMGKPVKAKKEADDE